MTRESVSRTGFSCRGREFAFGFLLYLDDTAFIELETTRTLSQAEIHQDWVWIAMALTAGAMSGALRAGGRRIALLTLREATKRAMTRIWPA